MPNLKLEALLNISQIDLKKPLNHMLKEILSVVGQEMNAHSGSIMLVNEETGERDMVVTFGLPEDYLEHVYRNGVPITDSPASVVLKTGEFYAVPNIFEEPRDKPWADLGRELGFSAQLFMPLKRKSTVIGLLNIQMEEPHEFSQNEITFVSIAASQAAAMIEHARLYARFKEEKTELESEVTEHKHMEELLWKSKESLSNILSASPIGIGIVKDRKLGWTNERMLEMMGFTLGDDLYEYIGQSAEVIYASKEEYERVGRIFYNELKGAKVAEADAKLKRRDGSLFDGHIIMSFLDPSDPVKGAIATISDISWRKQVEEALEQSEEMYRTLFENTGIAMMVVEDDMTISHINDEMAKVSGYSKEEIEGKVKWPDFIVKDDRSRMEEYHHLRQVGPEAVPRSYEFQFIHKQGDVRDASLTATLIPGTKRSVIAVKDITEKKRLEEDLRQSETLYRTFFEVTNAPTVILNEDGTFYRVNEEGAKISGFTKEELEGKKSWTEFIARKEDLERMKKIHQARRDDPDSAPSHYEFLFRDRYGNLRNIYVAAGLIPGTRQSAVSFMDITERKRAEEALRESEERFHSFFDNLSVGIAMVDTEGHILAVNKTACRFLAYSQEELTGVPLTTLIYPEDLKAAGDPFKPIIEGREDHCLMDKRHVQKDGGIVWGRLHVSGIKDEEGHVKYLSVICEDITACKLVEEALISKDAEMASVIIKCKHMKEALQRSEKKYKEIAEFLPDLIYKSILLDA